MSDAESMGREEFGRILGYGCRECETAWWKGADVHPLTTLDEHLRMHHDGDRSPVVIVREDEPFAGGAA